MLPCVVFFIDGVTTDRLVGFDELGERDSFTTIALEKRLMKTGVIEMPTSHIEQMPVSSIKKGSRGALESDDESSNFDSD